jgi:DNA primase
MKVRVLELEGGHDPDEYIQQNGAEMYRARVEKAPGYFLWLADRARASFDMRTSEGRIAGLRSLVPAVQRVPDKMDRAAIMVELADYLQVDRSIVADRLYKDAIERREKSVATVKDLPRRHVERILLNALLTSEDVRRAVLPRLKAMPACEQFVTRRIFQALFAIDESQASFRFTELEARLSDPDKELLASLVFADKPDDEEYSLEKAVECLRRLEQDARDAQRAALKARIKDAERAGMLEEALRIAEELARLERT